MRVFLCAFRGFYTAIPIDAVLALTLHSDSVIRAVDHNEETGNTFFSLPHLFSVSGYDTEHIRHGIVLKDCGGENGGRENEENDTVHNKNILLTTAVEREAEIPGAEIYPLPEIVRRMRGSVLFSGIQFVRRPAEEGGAPVILVLDPVRTIRFMTAAAEGCRT
jgi:hypothetical protein